MLFSDPSKWGAKLPSNQLSIDAMLDFLPWRVEVSERKQVRNRLQGFNLLSVHRRLSMSWLMSWLPVPKKGRGREVHSMNGMFVSSVFKTILKRLLLFIIIIIITLHSVIINGIIIQANLTAWVSSLQPVQRWKERAGFTKSSFDFHTCTMYHDTHLPTYTSHAYNIKDYDSDDDYTQVVRFARQMLYPVSHPTIPHHYVKPLRRERTGDQKGYNKDKGEVRGQTSGSFWCGHHEGFSVRTEE